MKKLKRIILGLALLCQIPLFSQENIDLTKLINKGEVINFWFADSLFNMNEYEKALHYYKLCDPIFTNDLNWPIKKALCYILNKDTISAQNYFRKYTYSGGHYFSLKNINQIPLVNLLFQDIRVMERFKMNTYNFQNNDSLCLFPKVQSLLINLREKDQFVRNTDFTNITSIDSITRLKLDSLITIYGWLGYNEVGESGENASWLIAQHSDLDVEFQKKCLRMLYFELLTKNISAQSFAMLYDRVCVNTNKKQLFGTQVQFNNEKNTFEPKKVISMRYLNAYRLYFGLETIESYIALMNSRN